MFAEHLLGARQVAGGFVHVSGTLLGLLVGSGSQTCFIWPSWVSIFLNVKFPTNLN